MEIEDYSEKKNFRSYKYLNLICLYNFNLGHNKFIQLSCCYLTELL